MKMPETTKDLNESLTPREMEVLRERFGLPEKTSEKDLDIPPSGSDDEDGSGGVPSPAQPLD